MKKTLLTLSLVLLTSSLQSASACSIKCEQKGSPSVAAVLGVVAGSAIFFDNRKYGTWVKRCEVVSDSGQVYYQDKISGAEVTAIGMADQSSGHQPGDNLNKKYSEKTSKQDIRLGNILNECNQSEAHERE
jgi:hypothetical protein